MKRIPRYGGCLLTGSLFLYGAFLPSVRSFLRGRSFFLICRSDWRLLPSIRAWSPPGEGQGVRGACPSTPPTTPVLPLSVWWGASLSHVIYLVRRSPQGASRRASSRFAGDMRACCGAPALRGSPSRPGSLDLQVFPCLCPDRRGAFFPWMKRIPRYGGCLLTGSLFLHGAFLPSVRSFLRGRSFFLICRSGWRLLPSIWARSPTRRATEWRPVGPCPLGDVGALRASTAEMRQGAGACAAPRPLRPRTPRWGSHP